MGMIGWHGNMIEWLNVSDKDDLVMVLAYSPGPGWSGSALAVFITKHVGTYSVVCLLS
jgi:hypothetical protein